MQIHPTNWNIHFLASDLRNSTSLVRFRRLSFNPTKEKRQWRLTIAVRFFWSGRRESRVRIANAQPLGASAFGRIPKNSPLDCFSTEFHLIGSIPSLKFQPDKRKTAMATNHCRTFFLERATGIEPASQAWEAWVITIIRRPHFSEKSIPHVTLGLIKILPVFNNPFEKAFSLMFSLHHLESRVS